MTCAELEAAQDDAGSEIEFFAAMAELTGRADAKLDPPAGDAGSSEGAPAAGADVSAAFARLAEASEVFAAQYPAIVDRSGADYEALPAQEKERYDVALEAMLTEHGDDFEVTWAWLSQVEAELGCSGQPGPMLEQPGAMN